MKIIEQALESTKGYILSFERNTKEGIWEVQAGFPTEWVFQETDDVGCEIIKETDKGRLLKLFPKKDDVVIDDLIKFVEVIIAINNTINHREKEFKSEIEEIKSMMHEKAEKFYKELEDLKISSFNSIMAEIQKSETKEVPDDLLEFEDGKPVTNKSTAKKTTKRKPPVKKTTTKE